MPRSEKARLRNCEYAGEVSWMQALEVTCGSVPGRLKFNARRFLSSWAGKRLEFRAMPKYKSSVKGLQKTIKIIDTI
jgi:hypothetical protein